MTGDGGTAAAARLQVTALRHTPALDGLRAIAALAVVGFHARIPGFAGGGVGVDVFFALSGFLITSILLTSLGTRGRVDFRSFYLRRVLRLMPAYVLVVIVAVGLHFVVDAGGTLRGAAASVVYAANWVAADGGGLGALTHMWSLSVEEQFYLVWPALLVLAVAATGRRVPRLRGLVAVGVVLAWSLGALALWLGASEALVHNATPARAVELLSGALLATWARPIGPVGARDRLAWDAVGGLALLGLLAVVVVGPPVGAVGILVGWPALSLLTCVLIAAAVRGGTIVPAVLASRPLVLVGRTSYGLYLWHFVVLATIDAAVGLDEWRWRLLGVALTAVAVPLSWHLVETPFLRLKDRRPPARTAPPDGLEAAA